MESHKWKISQNRFYRKKLIKNKPIIKIIVLIVITISLVTLYLKNNNSTIELNIKNLTDKNISNLKLNYTDLENDIIIPTINKNNSITFKVKINENFSEGTMKLHYIENNQYKEITIIGYFEKGYSAKINLNISEENGNLTIEIE